MQASKRARRTRIGFCLLLALVHQAGPMPARADEDAESRQLFWLALDRMLQSQTRVMAVADRMRIASAALCGSEVAPVLGIYAADHHTFKAVAPVLGAIVGRRQDFERSRKEEVEAAFGTGDDVTVFAVAANSPAERAGLLPRDRILALDGHRLRKSVHAFDRMRAARGPVAARVQRADTALDLVIPKLEACAFGTLLFPSWSADTETHANKKEMIVPTGLLHFVENDDELAIALAHQLGHQVLGRFRSVEHEARADEIGLRIAARAGFDVSGATGFWDRWAAEQFWKVSSAMEGDYVSHGAMARRAPVIRKLVAELGAGAQAPKR